MDIKCLDCGEVGVAKTSKAGKIYYQCPTCPGTDPKYKKFLTFLDEAHNYGKEKGGKRKATTTKESPKKIQVKEARDEALHAKIDRLMSNVDRILERVESLLDKPEEETREEEEESE
jgi:uncharacterized C2H2 Zn-finger protein